MKPGIPGVDYDVFDCAILGKPSALKWALSDIGCALGFLGLGDPAMAIDDLVQVLRRHGLEIEVWTPSAKESA